MKHLLFVIDLVNHNLYLCLNNFNYLKSGALANETSKSGSWSVKDKAYHLFNSDYVSLD